jgi:hypothetical protein
VVISCVGVASCVEVVSGFCKGLCERVGNVKLPPVVTFPEDGIGL